MTVTQYIGARYVPLFADPAEWDSTREYEPLTIVLYQGASYTSRQAVPVGVSISNTDYWVLTGNYNAQVEQYRTEVRTFDSRITANAQGIAANTENIAANTQAIAANTENIAANTQAIADNAEDISANTQAIGTLENYINSAAGIYGYFKNHNVVIIGDSYAYGTGASDHLSGDTKRFSSLLCSKLQATEFNFAVGSTGFCDPGSGGQNAPFKTQVLTAANSMTAEQRRNTHLVVIAGGVNDYNEGSTYSSSAMQAGAHDAAQNAAGNFPNALILVVPMLFKGADANPRLLNFENSLINGIGGPQSVARTVFIRGAWTWNFGMSSHYANDNLHPNDLGHQTIASEIYSHIMGGSAYENRLCFIDWESGFSSNVNNGGYLQFYNGMITANGMIVSGSVNSGDTTKIGSISTGCAIPLVNVFAIVSKSNRQGGIAIITDSGNLYVHATENITDFYIAPFNYLPEGALM